MRKRVFALITALVMIMALLPTALAADAAVTVNNEAALVQALESGAADVTLGADIALTNTLTIKKSVVLDLGGHTLTMPPEIYSEEQPEENRTEGIVINAPETAQVVIQNGSIDVDETLITYAILQESGTLTLSDMTITAICALWSYDKVTAIENCTVNSAAPEYGMPVIYVSLGGDIGEIKDSTINFSIGVWGIEGVDEEWLKNQEAEGRKLENGHIGLIENSELSRNVDGWPVIYLGGGGIDTIKGTSLTMEDVTEGTAISMGRGGKIGSIETCEITVTGDGWNVGIGAWDEDAMIGSVTDTTITVSGWGNGIAVTDGGSIGVLNNVTVCTDNGEEGGSAIGMWDNGNGGGAIGEIKNSEFNGGVFVNNSEIGDITNVTIDGNIDLGGSWRDDETQEIRLETGTLGNLTNVTLTGGINTAGDYWENDELVAEFVGAHKIGDITGGSYSWLSLQHAEVGDIRNNTFAGEEWVVHVDNSSVGAIVGNKIEETCAVTNGSTVKSIRNNTVGASIYIASPNGVEAMVGKVIGNTASDLTIDVWEEDETVKPDPATVVVGEVSGNTLISGDFVGLENHGTIELLGENVIRGGLEGYPDAYNWGGIIKVLRAAGELVKKTVPHGGNTVELEFFYGEGWTMEHLIWADDDTGELSQFGSIGKVEPPLPPKPSLTSPGMFGTRTP